MHQGRERFVHLLFHFFFAEMTFLAAKKTADFCQNFCEFCQNFAEFCHMLTNFFREFPDSFFTNKNGIFSHNAANFQSFHGALTELSRSFHGAFTPHYGPFRTGTSSCGRCMRPDNPPFWLAAPLGLPAALREIVFRSRGADPATQIAPAGKSFRHN